MLVLLGRSGDCGFEILYEESVKQDSVYEPWAESKHVVRFSQAAYDMPGIGTRMDSYYCNRILNHAKGMHAVGLLDTPVPLSGIFLFASNCYRYLGAPDGKEDKVRTQEAYLEATSLLAHMKKSASALTLHARFRPSALPSDAKGALVLVGKPYNMEELFLTLASNLSRPIRSPGGVEVFALRDPALLYWIPLGDLRGRELMLAGTVYLASPDEEREAAILDLKERVTELERRLTNVEDKTS